MRNNRGAAALSSERKANANDVGITLATETMSNIGHRLLKAMFLPCQPCSASSRLNSKIAVLL
jgi:hypothetical protein